MSIKDSLKLSSGWGWGIVGFLISTLLSWMAPFGKLPRLYFERAYENFERGLVSKGHLSSLRIRDLSFEKLLDYPGSKVDFAGHVLLENVLSTETKVEKVSLSVNQQPLEIRFWDPQPTRLASKEQKEFKFITTPLARDPADRYSLHMDIFDSLGRIYSAEAATGRR